MKISYLTLPPIVTLAVTVAGAVALAQQPKKPTKAPTETPASTPKPPRLVYTCPMHPQVVQPKPGTCPLCQMSLQAKVVGVVESHKTTTRGPAPLDHKALPMPSHENMHGMQMENDNMSDHLHGCGMHRMKTAPSNMELNRMDGMNPNLAPATAKPAAAQNYSSGRGGGRGCGC